MNNNFGNVSFKEKKIIEIKQIPLKVKTKNLSRVLQPKGSAAVRLDEDLDTAERAGTYSQEKGLRTLKQDDI